MENLKNIFSKLSDDKNIKFSLDTDLSKYSTMKLSAKGSIIFVDSVDALEKVVRELAKEKVSYKLIGWGANFIIPVNPSFVLVKLTFPFDRSIFSQEKKEFWIPSSAPLNILTSIASKFGFQGWEVFTGVPASLGGAIAMNAGTSLGEICELIKEVKLLRTSGHIECHSVTKDSFSYRKNHFLNEGDVILEALVFHKGIDSKVNETIKNYLKLRTESQPLKQKTCGCMFKNLVYEANNKEMTCRAGLSIDIMGLKGLSVNDLRISPKHANFMENRGEAASSDVTKLIEVTKRELKLQYGVEFETEVHFPK